MTQDEITKMAIQKAGLKFHDEIIHTIFEGVLDEAVKAEREACAKIADEWAVGWPHPSQVIAERIRERT